MNDATRNNTKFRSAINRVLFYFFRLRGIYIAISIEFGFDSELNWFIRAVWFVWAVHWYYVPKIMIFRCLVSSGFFSIIYHLF